MIENIFAFIEKLNIKFDIKSLCDSVDSRVQETLKDQIEKSIYDKIVRICILDIYNAKSAGNLMGDTPVQQYEYYCRVLLNDEAHIKDLCERYTEMYRLIKQEIQNKNILLKEILKSLEADREDIVRLFCNNKSFEKVVDLNLSIGDSHNGGKCAAKIKLDNGTVLYYKPHNLRKNQKYHKLFEYLCRSLKISCKNNAYLVHEDYGWEEEVENKCCDIEEEVKRYYFRMGIHLLIGYALSVTDLHGENIVANGEHPVIIDMETYPGYFIKTEESSAERKIETFLAGSVTHTGILPVLIWGKGDGTIIMSAMNGATKITTPFRMPVVKNKNTSDMYIDYEPIQFEMKESVVRLQDEIVNASEYTEDLVRGFQSAYRVMLHDQYVQELLAGFFEEKSRVILRHTQQYAMYRSVSLHPDYMGSREQRKKLLSVMHKDKETQLEKKIHDYEISCLLDMDIPYFEIDGHSCGLYDGNGKYYDNYLPCSPYQAWKMHFDQMDMRDMNQQSELIRLSMAMLGGTQIEEKQNIKFMPSPLSIKMRIEEQIHKIVSWVCSSAVIAGQDVNWIGLQFWDKQRWGLVPSGMYLYSGISGMALLLAEYLELFEDKEVENIFQMAIKKMMRYTDELCDSETFDKTLRTGLYEGESSIVYAYLLMHKMTDDMSYLRYAELHFQVVENNWQNDTCYDYLSGNAGAIVVAMMLYVVTKKEDYLILAVQMEKCLWENRQDTEHGVGWVVDTLTKPLAGMAHGNSGFLMAYAELYEHTQNSQYLYKIAKILEYEDSLYLEETGNWADLRASSDNKHSMNAWCHGAPGILLARLRLVNIFQSDIIAKNIQRASQALFSAERDWQICLCHGMAGKLLIMQTYLEKCKDTEYKIRYEQALDKFLCNLENPQSLSVVEYLNPAFMNGISGVAFALIELYKNYNCLQ